MKTKLLFVIFLISFSINSTFACSCVKAGIIKGQKQSDFVFTGKVIEVNKIVTKEKMTGTENIIDYKRFEFVFEIKHIHKKNKDLNYTNRITIITSGGGADCGNYFELNKKYLVYAYKHEYKVGWGLVDQKAEKEFMSTNLCTRTKPNRFFTFLEQLILELT